MSGILNGIDASRFEAYRAEVVPLDQVALSAWLRPSGAVASPSRSDMATFAYDVASSRGGVRLAKTSIGVRELKDKLSATLARVRRGATVTVTDRNRPVAVIIPARSADEEGLVRTLAKSGRLAWSGGKPRGLGKAPRVRGPSVSDAVVEDRR